MSVLRGAAGSEGQSGSATKEIGMFGSLWKKSNLGFGLALAVLVGIAFISLGNGRKVAEEDSNRQDTYARLDKLQAFLALTVDIETGARGYVITSDPIFLEPYHWSMPKVLPQLQDLLAAFADDPRQQNSLAGLEAAALDMLNQATLVVSLKAAKEDDSAQRAVATGLGKKFMDQIREHIAALSAEERLQLHQRDQLFQAGLQRSSIIIVVGSILGFAALASAALLINRILRERTRLNAELQRSLADNAIALERLRSTGGDLLRSNQELEQFAYIASHDLQEPLRKISSFAQLLESQYGGKLDTDANEFIGFMVDGAKRMQTLIQNLLSYSRLGRKGQPFAWTDGNDALKQSLVNLETAIEESGAEVSSDPLPTVLADRIQWIQLFQNLIGNAIKFHGGEKPRIHLHAEATGPTWTFSVKDNGIGIEPQFAERIFVIFQRLHSREEYAGTGIGLAFCKKIVERHGGRIWLEPQQGPGATFRFTFPRTEKGAILP